MSDYLVREQLLIPAEAQSLFDLVACPGNHPRIDGSGSLRQAWDGNPQRLALGSTFSMDMHLRFNYTIRNTVVEFKDGHQIAWRHFYGHRWRYLFEPVEGGTLVTEEWDARPAKSRVLLQLLGFPNRNRASMAASLKRLADLAES